MKRIYFISGLGADKRVFSFLDLSFCQSIFIDWIVPEKNELLEKYAIRLRQQISDDFPLIIGIFFGGMLVTEMAKADKKIKAIIISSNKLHSELPLYFRLGKYLPLYKLLPSFILKKVTLILKGVPGAKGEGQKKNLKQIILDTNTDFLKWAIGAILNWDNKVIPENLIHIHGTADRVLPYRLVKADDTILNGTHVMPLNQHEEISNLLRKIV